eukprot:gene4352-4773_t
MVKFACLFPFFARGHGVVIQSPSVANMDTLLHPPASSLPPAAATSLTPLSFPSTHPAAASSSSSSSTPTTTSSLEQHYRLEDQIGKGGFAIVKSALHIPSGQRVAIKIAKSSSSSQLEQEYTILLRLCHPNIVQAFALYHEKDSIYLILEYMEGGELFDRIVEKKRYTEQMAQEAFQCILSAIDHFHSRGVIHRDLKPENLLLSSKEEDAIIKVADFGLARIVEMEEVEEEEEEEEGEEQQQQQQKEQEREEEKIKMKVRKKKEKQKPLVSRAGTPDYIAPEIIQSQPVTKAVDMWAAGVILFILLGGYSPFHKRDKAVMFQRIVAGQFTFHPQRWSHVSEEAKDLICKLLTIDPLIRFTAKQALRHEWFGGSGGSGSGLDGHFPFQRDLSSNLQPLRQFNAMRKLRASVHTIMIANRMRKLYMSEKREWSEVVDVLTAEKEPTKV